MQISQKEGNKCFTTRSSILWWIVSILMYWKTACTAFGQPRRGLWRGAAEKSMSQSRQHSQGEVGENSVPCFSNSLCPPFVFHQIARFDVDGLFSNIESVHQISAKLLSLLEEVTTDMEPAMQVIGMFAVLFELYKAVHNNENAIKLPFPIPSSPFPPAASLFQ